MVDLAGMSMTETGCSIGVMARQPWWLSARPLQALFQLLARLQPSGSPNEFGHEACSCLMLWVCVLQAQVRLCTVCTLAACLPSMAHQILRPSPTGLLLGMANSALAFFIFSFQASYPFVSTPPFTVRDAVCMPWWFAALTAA